MYRLFRYATSTVALALVLASPATATPVTATLRVEGSSSTIFEQQLVTDGHEVTTAAGGTHRCDGTNNDAHPTPGPTATAALDDGALIGGFTWDGSWTDELEDYFVSRIGQDTQTTTAFWGLYVNYQSTETGGCQQRVGPGDEVLWAYDAFSKQFVLRLAGSTTAKAGERVTLIVTDGPDGSPVAGASVGGAVTGPDGRASVTFDTAGTRRLKAEHPAGVRSNALVICAYDTAPAECSSAATGPTTPQQPLAVDRVAPTVRLRAPAYASDVSTRPRFPVRWSGRDRGSGIARYRLELRALGSARWRLLARATTATAAVVRGRPGRAYALRLRARDRAGNLSAPSRAITVVPLDERNHRLRLDRRWRRAPRTQAYGGTIARGRRGARAALRFSGAEVAVIARRAPGAGGFVVEIDGRRRIVRLSGARRDRAVVFRARRLRRGRHLLRLEVLRREAAELDGIAIRP
jgi:hypothetical protein